MNELGDNFGSVIYKDFVTDVILAFFQLHGYTPVLSTLEKILLSGTDNSVAVFEKTAYIITHY